MSQGPLCPNLSQKVQKEVSQMANRKLSSTMLSGGLSVSLNHLKGGGYLPKEAFLKEGKSLKPLKFSN